MYIFLIFIATLIVAYIAIILITTPSNNRAWNDDQAVLPYADIDGDHIAIHNIRNFEYTTEKDYKIQYYDKSFDVRKIKKAWYIVVPFEGIPGSAHTFLSFEFENNEYLAISIEIRKEKGEIFNPIKGLFNQFEIMYVIADEKDVVKLRAIQRKNQVYMYPIKAEKSHVQELFVDMIEKTNHLKDHPEFYNTAINSCATNIVHHVNKIIPGRVPFFDPRVLLPANSDHLAYKLGLIDTDLSFAAARKHFLITERAQKYVDNPDFSKLIREEN